MSTCSLDERFEENTTPKSLTTGTEVRGMELILCGKVMDQRERVKVIELHFS